MKNRVSLAVLLALITSACFGEMNYEPGDNPLRKIKTLYRSGYLGGDKDLTPISTNILASLDNKIPASDIRRLEIAIEATEEIRIYFNSAFDDIHKNKLEEDLTRALRLAAQELSAKKLPLNFARPGIWEIDKDSLSVRLSEGLELDYIAVYIDGICSDPASEGCRKSFDRAIHAIRCHRLMHIILLYVNRNHELEPVIKDARHKSQQWDSYFKDGFPQWPWELWINGRLYNREVENSEGLADLPTWQWIVLHPDVAMQYVDEADDGDQFRGALTVELIGFNMWQWDGTDQKGPWFIPWPVGAGIVASYADRSGVEDWGIGGVVHVNNIYNLGVTTHDGDVGVFVSANVAKLFTEVTKKVESF